MSRTKVAAIVAGAFALGLAAFCHSGPAARAQDVIKIAAGAPITGQLAKQGQEVVNAVKLAADDWNKKGGVLGKKIEVFEADDQGNPQVGVAAAEKVAADPAVMGAVWGITSVTCIPASEVLDKSDIVLITPGCTNPKVTDRNLKSVERVCARDDLQGPAAAVFMIRELKMKKIAAIDDGTTGPRGITDAFEMQAKKMGATVLRYVIRAGDKDFRSILGTIPKDIDGIYGGVWAPDEALIAKQLLDVGLHVHIVGGDGDYEPIDYIQAAGGAAEGNYVTFLVPDIRKIPQAADFLKSFESKYGTLSSYGPLAYEAANILLSSIQKVGKPDRAAIRDAVRATSNYQGILGSPLTFDEKGDVKGAQIYIYQVQGDNFQQLTSVTLSGS
jgi:branched-chain amino acid transport system substrate-binding protein